MIKKIMVGLFINGLTTLLFASDDIVLPPHQFIYRCQCDKPIKGICRRDSDHPKKNSQSLPPLLKLNGGWIVQPMNCKNKVTYHFTLGSILFSGKKMLASYGNPKIPAKITGYMYHVIPNLPFTEQSYSVSIVKNPAISGIDLSEKNNGWHCGSGNALTSCHSTISSAQCFVGSQCGFLYHQK